MPAHLEEATNAASVGNDAMSGFRKHELRVVGGDADIAQQRSLERTADGPPLDWDDDGCIEIKELLNSLMAACHEFVMCESSRVIAD